MMPSPHDIQSGQAWRRFLAVFLGTILFFIVLIYGFIITIDPWDQLPLSPRWHRIPISSNARYSMPALAESQRFDSALLGTSTGRLLQPDQLNGAFGAHFVNLAMNSATPWEQRKLLQLFTRHHPAPRVVMIDLDRAWCFPAPADLAGPARPFPYWMYDGSPWKGYLEMANLYALQEAANQFMWLAGLKHQRYGSDGYTNFLPPDGTYDPVRAEARFHAWPRDLSTGPARDVTQPLSILHDMLAALPDSTLRILWFPPSYAGLRSAPETRASQTWQACRAEVALIARGMPNTIAVNFNIPGRLTDPLENFWDPLHYRLKIASSIMQDLNRLPDTGSGDFTLLGSGPALHLPASP